jgi:hypothetical protein
MGMTVDQLKSVHPLHQKNKTFWDFLLACYEGIRALIEWGIFTKHERESLANFNRRVDEAYGFSYSQSIVDIFNHYLFKTPPVRDLGPLKTDKQYEMFQKDCDLYGEPYESWLLETGRYASIMGHVGILVDKSGKTFGSKGEELTAGVYPYVARYHPQNILDWEYDKDENGRPYLSMVKLLDDDQTYIVWTTEKWERYALTDDDLKAATTVQDVTAGATGVKGGGVSDDKQNEIAPTEWGANPFIKEGGRGEIPFLWYYNIKSKTRGVGVSDIKDVAYIDASIIRNLSEGEEVINFAAFPMMRKPMREAGAASEKGTDEAGVVAILEFDPEKPESKPDWLESKVKEPLDSMLMWIAKKAEEIYRTSNAGGMASTEIQTQAKSGVALKSEFQLLNSKLVSKGNNTEKAERGINRYWMMWQKTADKADQVTVERSKSYDVEDLASDLENALTAKTLVQSEIFVKTLQKRIARQMLPNMEDDEMDKIDKEIEASTYGPAANAFGAGAVGDETQPAEGSTGGPGGKLVPLPTGKGGAPGAAPSTEAQAAAGGE